MIAMFPMSFAFYVICLQYVAEMVEVFARTTEHLCNKLNIAANNGVEVEMESLFSRLTLDIIGKAVFNYDFDSLSYDKGVAEVYFHQLLQFLLIWFANIVKIWCNFYVFFSRLCT